jgi:maltose alpha-D-glucosyltransferase/alpha-amylase
LMDNDRRKIELMNSLLLSFPGTPIIYYGDEIGMGDNIYLGDRNGVRTPMQWSPDRNGGFSRADPARLFAPVIMDPVYGYEAVNVEAQSRSISSLLSWTKRLIAVRKSTQAFGRGSMTFVRPKNRAVLGYIRQHEDEVILCVANLSRSAQAAELDLSAWHGRIPLEMLGRTEFPQIGEHPYMITLAPYSFYWFKLQEKPVSPLDAPSLAPEVETLVIPAGSTWESLGRARGVFDRDVLPPFLARSRWFEGHGNANVAASVAGVVPFAEASDTTAVPWLVIVDAHKPNAGRYLIPMQIDWRKFDREQFNPQALSAVRQGSREGTLLDATPSASFVSLLLENMRASTSTEALGFRLEFKATTRFASKPFRMVSQVRAIETGHLSTTLHVDDRYVVKLQRKLEAGVDPEIEIGSFLTGVAGFTHTPALLGTVKLVHDGARTAVASVHEFVQNQGDAWAVTAGYLDRFIDEQRLIAGTEDSGGGDQQVSYQRFMLQAGRRFAEMQTALASRDDIEDFRPEPATAESIDRLVEEVINRLNQLCDALGQARERMSDADRALAGQILTARPRLQAHIEALRKLSPDWMDIRHHGDFHLGQMLVVKDDIFIVNLEGEPHRALAERRRKAPAARDVAGVLRSIDNSVAIALDRALKVSVDDRGKVAAALEQWRDQSAATFMTAYHEALAETRLWPADALACEYILQFFVLERALYEVDYELNNRPERAHVPMTAVLRAVEES